MKPTPIELAVLLDGAQPSKAGRNPAWIGFARTEKQDQTLIRVKLLSNERLITELVCAALGEALAVPVPKTYVVQVQPNLNPSIPVEKTTIAIGSEMLNYPDCGLEAQKDEAALRERISKWQKLHLCAAFDIWVGVEDRYPQNMLYREGNGFSIIDFDDALKPVLAPTTPTRSDLANFLASDKTDQEKLAIRQRILAALGDTNVDWGMIRDAVPVDLVPDGGIMTDKKLDFLAARAAHLFSLVGSALAIKQLDIAFSSTNADNNR